MAVGKRYIPRDIVRDILLLQPSKSLQRFKTICKSWNTIITDHDFVRDHHQQSKNSRNPNMFLWKGREDICTAKFENGKFQVEAIREKPHHCKELLCSGDGLALFSTSCSKSYVLWNLCSKQKTTITCNYRFDLQFPVFGISRGPNWDDYKIVALDWDHYFVFSCKNESWSRRKIFPFILGDTSSNGGLFAGGFCFWITEEFVRYMPEIVYFDPRDEEFKRLQQPMEVEMERNRNISLTSFRGCLCFYDNINLRKPDQVRLRIWILRDNDVDSSSWSDNDDGSSSWSELLIINDVVDDGLVPDQVITPLFFANQNELVIRLGVMKEEFGVYNSVEKKYQVFDDVPRSLICSHDSIVSPCLDTLYFPMSSESKLCKEKKRKSKSKN